MEQAIYNIMCCFELIADNLGLHPDKVVNIMPYIEIAHKLAPHSKDMARSMRCVLHYSLRRPRESGVRVVHTNQQLARVCSCAPVGFLEATR